MKRLSMAAIDETGTAEADPVMRRAPSQKRSRERVEHILASASKLIAERGSDAMRMSEVADISGISIGSLYQYFPDKSAIVRTLAERCNAAGRACIADGLAPVTTPEELRSAFCALIDEYYAMFLAEPVIRDIWSAMQADKALMAIELAETRENAALLAEALRRVRPDLDSEALNAQALLTMHLGESTMRLAISLDETEGRAVVEAYKRMACISFSR